MTYEMGMSGWQPASVRGDRFLSYLDGKFGSARRLVKESCSTMSIYLCFLCSLSVTPIMLFDFAFLLSAGATQLIKKKKRSVWVHKFGGLSVWLVLQFWAKQCIMVDVNGRAKPVTA